MEASLVIKALISFFVVGLMMIWGLKILNWVWLKPRRLERCLRQQGLAGNPYRFLSGDMKENFAMSKQARAKPMPLSDDIVEYVAPFLHQIVRNYGKNSFLWMGPKPRVIIMDPEELREIFTKFNDFQKPHSNPLFNLLVSGLVDLEGDKWAKHRKIINPAFLQDKLKSMLLAFHQSCVEMISKWEKMVSVEGCSELDVWPCKFDQRCDFPSSIWKQLRRRKMNFPTTRGANQSYNASGAVILHSRMEVILLASQAQENKLRHFFFSFFP